MAQLDFLDEIARYLDGAVAGITEGTNIFVNELPESPGDCVSLWGLPGTSPGDSRDVPGLQFPRFQLIVRNADYNTAADLFQLIRTALHGKVNLILPVGVNVATTNYIRVMRCHIDTEGGPLGKDDQGRSEFSANYIAEYHHYDPTP